MDRCASVWARFGVVEVRGGPSMNFEGRSVVFGLRDVDILEMFVVGVLVLVIFESWVFLYF